MRHYCTLFDRNYAARGLVLHRTLLRHCGEFTLHILCLDAPTRDALAAMSLPRVKLLDLGTLESADSALRDARPDRSPLEFYFTCKPALLGYLLDRVQDMERVDYLDADLAFFSDPAPLEAECAGSSVALSPHSFSARHAAQRQYGEFNAGWLSVASDQEGRSFVSWWRERCLEWCRLSVEETRFGDQKYLDQVPARFPRALRVSHPGANLAPWNLDKRCIELTKVGPTVDSRPLVFFHFHGLKRMLFGFYESGMHEYGEALTSAMRKGIYRPYVRELAACNLLMGRLPPALRAPIQPARPAPGEPSLVRRLISTARAVIRQSAVFGTA